MSRLESLWDRVDRTEAGCWEYTGPCGPYTGTGWSTPDGLARKGYGKHGNEYAHRLAYRLTYGPIEPGLVIAHTCDNPPCCNPAHLVAMTQSENMADSVRKRRAARNNAPSAKVGPELTKLAALVGYDLGTRAQEVAHAS